MRLTTPLSAALLLNSRVSAQSSGVFNVLAMNVAGLPAILNSNDVPGDKTVNAETIGAKLSANGIDVAHLQEVRVLLTLRIAEVLIHHQSGLQLPCRHLQN